jgi:signal transduction histidine kinase
MFKTLRGRIVATYFLVVIISLVVASVVFVFFLARYIRNRDREDLRRQVGVVARDIAAVNKAQAGAQAAGQAPAEGAATRVVSNLLNTEARVLKAKLALVTPEGTVVSESNNRPMLGRLKVELPAGIFGQNPKVTRRFFKRLGKDYLFATSPTTLAESAQGYLLAMQPVEQLGAVAGSLVLNVLAAGLIALALSMLLALYLSSAISRPVRAVTEAARSMAAGDYGQEVPVRGSDETAELARDFNIMAERVRTSHELQRNFVGDVSHELRTPLTSIEGFSQALLDGVSTGADEQRRSLEIINQESKRLNRLLSDLLLLSRIDAGELRPGNRPVDLVDLVRKLENLYSARARAEGIELKVATPAGGLNMNTDPDRLERVLTNLLDNALKYAGASGTVSLSAQVLPPCVQFSVADTGPGIPPEQLPRIFDRFYRLEQSRAQKHGGSGLGLSITKELVETLGGTIKVQSLVGHGTTFTLTFPLG